MLFLECYEKLVPIINLIKSFLGIIQILIPIALIVLGTLDLGKAVVASDENAIKKAQSMLVKRMIAAVLVFFVALIVSFVMGLVGNNNWKECWTGKAAAQLNIDSEALYI